MTVETSADRLAFFDADEFGEAVTWTAGASSATITGTLSAPVSVFDVDAEAGIVMAAAEFICPAALLPSGAAQGDLIAARVLTWWTVRALLPDGTGMVRVLLESAQTYGIGMLDFSESRNSQYLSLI